MTLVKNFQSLVEIFHVREKLETIPPLARVLSSLILAALRKDSKLQPRLIPQTGKRKKNIRRKILSLRAARKKTFFLKEKCVFLLFI